MTDRNSTSSQSRPGEIVLTKLDIFNYDKTRRVSLIPQFLSLNIIEDMFKPTIYGHVVIQDPVDFLTQFPFLGEEKLEIEYYCPFRGDGEYKRKFQFYVYGIDGYTPDITTRNAVYTLKFISVEHLENSKKLLSRNFKGKVTDILRSLVIDKQFLGSDKTIHFEETTDELNYTLPKQTCFEMIEFFRSRAYTKASDVHSPDKSNDFFVFYENSEGFIFKSIGKLIKDGFEYNKRLEGQNILNEIYYANFAAEKIVSELDKQTRNASLLTYVSYADSFSALRNGGLKNRVFTYDFATRKFEQHTFVLKDKFDDFLHLDDTDNKVTSGIRHSDEFLRDIKEGHQPRDLIVPIDSTNVGDVKYFQRMGFAVSYLDSFGKSPLKASIYGDPVLRAGDIINLRLPEFTGATEGREENRYQAGHYIIGRLAHTIENTQNQIYKMTCDLYKESFKYPIKPNPGISVPVTTTQPPYFGTIT